MQHYSIIESYQFEHLLDLTFHLSELNLISFQTLNSKLNIDEPLKAIKVIDFLLSSFVLGLIDITAAGYDLIYLLLQKLLLLNITQIWHASYFLTTLCTFSEPLQVLKSLLMSGRVESAVLDEDRHTVLGCLRTSF